MRNSVTSGMMLALLLALPITANAEKLARIATVTGTCKMLIVRDTQATCSNKVASIEFPNGRNGFTFFANGKDGHDAVISFYGDGKSERHPHPDTAVK